jgi:hypothetical protein
VPLLYRTTDAALAQAAVDALIKRGVEAYATGSAATARGEVQPQYSVFLRKAADVERATRILAHVGAAPALPAAAARPPRWLVWVVVLLAAALAMLVALQSGGAP